MRNRAKSSINFGKMTQNISSDVLQDLRVQDYIDAKLRKLVNKSKLRKKIPKEEFSSVNQCNGGDDYCFKAPEKLLNEEEFMLWRISEKKSGEKKIVQIWDKQSLQLNKTKLKNIQHQILLYEQLKKKEIGKEFILNLDSVFEDKKKLYLVFEDCEIIFNFDNPEFESYQFMNAREIKNAICSTYFAIREINSFKHSLVCTIGVKLVKKASTGTFALFNFPFLSEQNSNLHISTFNYLKNHQGVLEDCLRKNGSPGCSTDSFTFGVLALNLIKLNLKDFILLKEKSKGYRESVEYLSPALFNLLEGLLKDRKSRIKLNHAVFHQWFDKNFQLHHRHQRENNTNQHPNRIIYTQFFSSYVKDILDFSNVIFGAEESKRTIKRKMNNTQRSLSKVKTQKRLTSEIESRRCGKFETLPSMPMCARRNASMTRTNYKIYSKRKRIRRKTFDRKKKENSVGRKKGFFGRFIDRIMCGGN